MAVLPLARGGSKKLNCFTLALLLTSLRSVLLRGLAATKKSVNDRPGAEQLANRGEPGRLAAIASGAGPAGRLRSVHAAGIRVRLPSGNTRSS